MGLAPPKAEDGLRRARVAGYLLALMVALACLNALIPNVPLWLSGAAAWLAAILLLARINTTQRLLCGLLVVIGVACMLYARVHGQDVQLIETLTRNQSLLTMLAAVSFLRLVTITSSAAVDKLPVGHGAFVKTLLGVGVFGAVINLSAPLLIADRIQSAGKLGAFTGRSITRIFSGCSGWSPFFGGMAVVLTYVPDARLSILMLAGLPFAIIGGLWTYCLARTFDAEKIRQFTGYPMDFRNLWIPALLAIYVALIHFTLSVSILIAIALGALLVTVSILLIRQGVTTTVAIIRQHIEQGLSSMGSELLLFLSASVLATGLAATTSSVGAIVPGPFTALTAVAVLAGMIVAACAGLHPVVLISMLASILASTQPEPNLLAFTFLLGWSMGTCCSPLSGTHLVFQARYGISSLRAAISNWPFVAIMFIVAVALIYVFEALSSANQ